MTMPIWVTNLAQRFWDDAGSSKPVPDKLPSAITWALPIDVVPRPEPDVAAVLDWLQGEGADASMTDMAVENRLIRACMLARHGYALLFVDSSDSEAEIRFSLSHELAHYLRQYLYRRRRIQAAVGASALEVLDGVRPATVMERADALLGHVMLGAHVHLMDRTPSGHPPTVSIAAAEREADLLAFELMAPSEWVIQSEGTGNYVVRRERLRDVLTTHYGFPLQPATQYAAVLAPAPARPRLSTTFRRLRASRLS
jgi:hypothetical protein